MNAQAQAAHDLRNAALVIEHAGLTRNNFMDGPAGPVCLDGALRVAVGTINYSTGHVQLTSQIDCLHYGRITAALEALTPLLPDTCTVHPDRFECGYCFADMYLPADASRVHHFNDFVCSGGEEASLLLLQAAEKLETEL